MVGETEVGSWSFEQNDENILNQNPILAAHLNWLLIIMPQHDDRMDSPLPAPYQQPG